MAPAWMTRAVPAVALAGATTACLWTIPTDGLSGGATDAATDSAGVDAGPGGVDDAADAAGATDAADAADGSKLPADAVVWSVNGHGYAIRVVGTGVTWEQARILADATGGHLASLGSQAESVFVVALAESRFDAFVGNGVGPWLGGHQPNPTPAVEPAGGWQWVDGTPWSFTSWQTNQPDDTNGVESYLDLIQRGGRTAWNDDSNTGTGGLVVSYVVEFE